MAEKCLNTDLATVAGGAAEELFQHGLAKVLANLVDPNCDTKKKRTLTLEFTFQVDPKRAGVSVGVELKKLGLVGPAGALTRFDLFENSQTGEPVAHEQERLDFSGKGAN